MKMYQAVDHTLPLFVKRNRDWASPRRPWQFQAKGDCRAFKFRQTAESASPAV